MTVQVIYFHDYRVIQAGVPSILAAQKSPRDLVPYIIVNKKDIYIILSVPLCCTSIILLYQQ
jgi:hypothetical protein